MHYSRCTNIGRWILTTWRLQIKPLNVQFSAPREATRSGRRCESWPRWGRLLAIIFFNPRPLEEGSIYVAFLSWRSRRSVISLFIISELGYHDIQKSIFCFSACRQSRPVHACHAPLPLDRGMNLRLTYIYIYINVIYSLGPVYFSQALPVTYLTSLWYTYSQNESLAVCLG
jgi:hypothetical protein